MLRLYTHIHANHMSAARVRARRAASGVQNAVWQGACVRCVPKVWWQCVRSKARRACMKGAARVPPKCSPRDARAHVCWRIFELQAEEDGVPACTKNATACWSRRGYGFLQAGSRASHAMHKKAHACLPSSFLLQKALECPMTCQ